MTKHEDIDHTGLTGAGGSVATDAIFDAAGDLVIGTGANTAARLAIGTNAYVLTSNGTTAAWAAASGGGATVFLQEQVASSSAQLDFTSFISATYEVYEFILQDILPATDGANLLMRVGTGAGPTYDTGANYGSTTWEWRVAGGASGGAEGGATSIGVTRNGVDNAGSTFSLAGRLTLYNPGSALYKYVNGLVSYQISTGGYRLGDVVTGTYEATTALTAIRFFMSSGNIASGTIRVYGIKKAA